MTKTTIALAACGVLLAAAPQLRADTIAKVEGIEVTDELFTAFAESRTRKPVAELTDAERERMTEELIKLVVVGAEARDRKLHKDPATAARLQLQELSLLAQTLVSKHLESNPVSEADIQARYDSRYAAAGEQTEYKARHILVTSPETAKQVIAELDGGGDFAALAAKYSTGPSAESGGDLGWFTKDRMVPEFGNAVAGMSNGDYSSEPVQTQFGWHVILKEDERGTPPPAIGAVGQELSRELQQQSIDGLVNGLRENAKVKTYD